VANLSISLDGLVLARERRAAERDAATLRAALKRPKIDGPLRPFHEGRHTNITNAAAAGVSLAALMARAGHSDFATTQLYIDLAGETFREEAELADERLFGQKLGRSSRLAALLASPVNRKASH
jgi:integrase